MVEKTDILVIGGGIIGTSVAYFLSKSSVDVTLVERSEIGREASAATAGSMALQNKELGAIALAQEALRVWAELQEELGEDLEFRQHGGLRVAESSEQLEALRESIREQRRGGLQAEVEILSARELNSFAPYLGPSVLAASFCEKDSRGNPLVASTAVAKAAQAQGAKICVCTEVRGIEVLGGHRFLVRTSRGVYRSSCIVNCAGVWAGKIFKMVGLDMPITVAPMQCMTTEEVPPMFPHIITHVDGRLTLKQMDNGNVVIGGGWEAIGDIEQNIKRVRYKSLEGNIKHASRVVPALNNVNIIRCWAGLEGRSPDLLPLLGNLRHLPGFYSATCTRSGFTMGPVLGKLISELITTGKTFFPVEGFDVNRFIGYS